MTSPGVSQEAQVNSCHKGKLFFQFDPFDRFDRSITRPFVLESSTIGNDNHGSEKFSAQNQGNFSLQQKPNRNCHVCGDHANGFNLNVPRYIL